jgi:hypothetical protein
MSQTVVRPNKITQIIAMAMVCVSIFYSDIH